MINKRQSKLLKAYKNEPKRADSSPTFHELTKDGYFDTVWKDGKDFYILSNKGLAELENHQRLLWGIGIALFSLGIAIAALIVAIVK